VQCGCFLLHCLMQETSPTLLGREFWGKGTTCIPVLGEPLTWLSRGMLYTSESRSIVHALKGTAWLAMVLAARQ
jgi:hypothetical protein